MASEEQRTRMLKILKVREMRRAVFAGAGANLYLTRGNREKARSYARKALRHWSAYQTARRLLKLLTAA